MPSTPAMAKNVKDVIIMRMPITEWLTAARRCNPGPVAQIAASSRCNRNAGAPCGSRSAGSLIFSLRIPPRRRPRQRSRAFLRAIDDDIDPHPCVTETAKFVALACVPSRLIGLKAQAVHMPGQRIDLAGEAGYPEGVDD